MPVSDDSRYLALVEGFKNGPQLVVDLTTMEGVQIAPDVTAGNARWTPGTHQLLYPRRLDYETVQWTAWNADGSPERLAGESSLKSGWAGTSRISPDFGAIAYARNVDTQANTADVFVFDVASGEEYSVGTGVRDFQMQWSPSGDWLTYLTDYVDGQGALHVWSVDVGSQLVAEQVLTDFSQLVGVVFDATGRWLTYTTGDCGETHALYVFDLALETHTLVSEHHVCQAGVFTGGGLIFFEPGPLSGAGELVRYELDTHQKRHLGFAATTTMLSTPNGKVTVARDMHSYYQYKTLVLAFDWVTGKRYTLLEGAGHSWARPVTNTHVAVIVSNSDGNSLHLLGLP
ncbi:MAG: hypothetical protein ACI9OJ_003102 [Myxococcota bacterium]|jgi:hypothetical protein